MMTSDVKSPNAPLFLVGATGTGKSEVAMTLVRAFAGSTGAAILALDAMQVYRGADIGTSKPSVADRAEFPHGGLDLADFDSAFDVAQYLKHAAIFLREQREAGRRVIIVGGTGLYFRALTRGLCEAPQGPEALRAELNTLTVEQLQARLTQIDAPMLARLDSANPRRLIRAIEVMETTGRSLHAWQEETPPPLVPEFKAFWLQRSKEELHDRIERRVEAMFAAGWVEEVKALVSQHGVKAVKDFAGIGYREIAEELEREAPSQGPATATLQRNILVATRQYAKRQLTWFSREPNLEAAMLSSTQPLPAALLPLI